MKPHFYIPIGLILFALGLMFLMFAITRGDSFDIIWIFGACIIGAIMLTIGGFILFLSKFE